MAIHKDYPIQGGSEAAQNIDQRLAHIPGSIQGGSEAAQNIDQRLAHIPSPNKINETAMAAKLAQAKNQARIQNEAANEVADDQDEDEDEEEDIDFGPYSPLAQMGNAARLQELQQAQSKKESDPASSNKAMDKIKDTLGKLLKVFWQNIIFYSFGTSIFAIDLFVFLNMIFPKMFPKLGHEWIPAELAKRAPKKAKSFGDSIGMVEQGCCCLANACCGTIWLIIITIICVIVYILAKFTEAALEIGQALVDELAKVLGL